MVDVAGKLISFRLFCRILRTSVNLKKLDVRGLQRISPEGIQVTFVMSVTIRLTKGSAVRKEVKDRIVKMTLKKLTLR